MTFPGTTLLDYHTEIFEIKMLKCMAWRFFKDLQELKILETSYYYDFFDHSHSIHTNLDKSELLFVFHTWLYRYHIQQFTKLYIANCTEFQFPPMVRSAILCKFFVKKTHFILQGKGIELTANFYPQ